MEVDDVVMEWTVVYWLSSQWLISGGTTEDFCYLFINPFDIALLLLKIFNFFLHFSD